MQCDRPPPAFVRRRSLLRGDDICGAGQERRALFGPAPPPSASRASGSGPPSDTSGARSGEPPAGRPLGARADAISRFRAGTCAAAGSCHPTRWRRGWGITFSSSSRGGIGSVPNGTYVALRCRATWAVRRWTYAATVFRELSRDPRIPPRRTAPIETSGRYRRARLTMVRETYHGVPEPRAWPRGRPAVPPTPLPSGELP